MRLCAVCNSTRILHILDYSDAPVLQNVLCRSRDEASNFPKAPISLYGCEQCGFVFNGVFDINKMTYNESYENSQNYSNEFKQYLSNLASYLYRKYMGNEKNVAEIGCGKGYFLTILKNLGATNLTGFDPSFVNNMQAEGIDIIKDYFSAKYKDKGFNFVICRHTLEHISKPKLFLQDIKDSLEEHYVGLYFETPNFKWIIKNATFFDIFYEHCNYFSSNSIKFLMSQFFKGDVIVRKGFCDQYLQVEVENKKNNKSHKLYGNYNGESLDFNEAASVLKRSQEKVSRYIDSLQGKKVVVWGAGAKGVTFLNRLSLGVDRVPFVIDINPKKQGCYIPGTVQMIKSPLVLKSENVDVVIGMNRAYEQEIREQLRALNFGGDLIMF